MLLKESLWFKYIIRKYVKPNSLVLNIGSSTDYFVEVEQPYIKDNVINVLQKKQCRIKNIDIKSHKGVDLVGDVTDFDFINRIKALSPDVIICSNLLEHLDNRKDFCDGLIKMMRDSTLLIVSVPYSFPYHEDPIDTLYRPDISDLKQAFGKLELIEGDIVKCGRFYSHSNRNKTRLASFLHYARMSRGVLRAFFINKERFYSLLWYFRRISATCAVFKSK